MNDISKGGVVPGLGPGLFRSVTERHPALVDVEFAAMSLGKRLKAAVSAFLDPGLVQQTAAQPEAGTARAAVQATPPEVHLGTSLGESPAHPTPYDEPSANPPRAGFLARPTELVDHFSYVLVYAPDDYPEEDGIDNPRAFQDMLEALRYFRNHCRTDEGREALDQCVRSLHNAFELYEQGNTPEAARFLQDTERSFKAARKFIALSDA